MNRAREWRMAVLFVAPLVVLIFGLIAVPFVDSIVLSFTARHGPDTVFVGLTNFFALPNDPTFRAGARNSYLFTVYSVLFKIVLGLIVALLLHNMRRGRALVAGIVLLPWVIPTVVTTFTWRAMLDPLFGSVNSVLSWLGVGPLLELAHVVDRWPAAWLADPELAMPSVIAVNVWKGIPFFAVNFLAGLKVIDNDLYEAAAVDGANAWQRFWHITVPGLRYVIVVTALLSSIWTFNNFDLIWLLTQGGPGQATTPYVLVAYTKAIQQLQYGAGAAVALVMVPIVGVLVYVLARYLRSQGPGAKESAIAHWVARYRRVLTWVGLAALAGSLVVLGPSIAWKAAIGLTVIVGLGVLFGRYAGGARFTGGSQRRVSRRLPAWLATAMVLLFVVGPLYWIVVTAFKTDGQIMSRSSDLFPLPWTTDQFTRLFEEQPFGTWYLNTIFVSTIATALTMVFAALAAYALARLRFRGAQTLTGAVLITYVMPSALLFIPMYQLLSDLRLIDSRWALILTYPTFTLPFATWLLLGYFRSIPVELEEAAMIDGATRFQAFLRIVTPLAKPALLAVALFTLTNAWNEFLFAFVFITSDDLKTLPVGMQSMIFGDAVPYGVLSAASLLISIPVVLMYSFGQRFLTEGLTVGAMKG